MVDMAVAEDGQRDVARLKAKRGQSAFGGLVGAEVDEPSEGGKTVASGAVGVGQVGGREAGVEQDVRARSVCSR